MARRIHSEVLIHSTGEIGTVQRTLSKRRSIEVLANNVRRIVPEDDVIGLDESALLFAYGIFRGGAERARWEGWEYLGARAVPNYSLYVTLGYSGPAYAIPRPGGTVNGDLYRMTGRSLWRLDAVERHPTWYRRRLVRTTDGQLCWIYGFDVIRPDTRPDLIEIGADWTDAAVRAAARARMESYRGV